MNRGLSRAIAVALLSASVMLVACERSVAACPKSPADTAAELIALFAGNALAPETAAALLGPQYGTTQLGNYWQLTSPACALEIVFPVGDSPAPLPEAELRLQSASRLPLSDLQRRFGSGETVYSSKTSSVLFRVPASDSGAPVLVFARLHSARPTPDSPVLTLVLRRDPVSK